MAKDRKEQMRLYNFNNKDKKTKYRQSDKGKKSDRITNWKNRGLISDNYDELYDRYIKSTKCELCNKKYKNTRDRHLDHDHDTHLFRNIVCRMCNTSSKLKQTPITNTSGHKNIQITKYGYKVQISVNKITYVKTFKTEEEAIEFRDFLI